MSLQTFEHIDGHITTLFETDTRIFAYDKTARPVLGFKDFRLKVGPLETSTKAYVLEMDSDYNMILGRKWLASIKGVSSPLHQCLKFPLGGRIIKIQGDAIREPKPRFADNETTAIKTSSSKPMETTIHILDFPANWLNPRNTPPVTSKTSHPRFENPGWHIMETMGYLPGETLGHKNGIMDPIDLPAWLDKRGIGSPKHKSKLEGKYNWKLYEHFVREIIVEPSEETVCPLDPIRESELDYLSGSLEWLFPLPDKHLNPHSPPDDKTPADPASFSRSAQASQQRSASCWRKVG
ncbi:hypothetical protein QJS10_CPA16g00613 [Acorus calamus]|uniref:G-patch domain-containing protein n=1 Tax=Acorus calamus TaxID=4465 RepID=A0AAV9D2Q3_ACOCL|nr:hypothetical protein QJS10_CPA16g00613 [Acorus calamus]